MENHYPFTLDRFLTLLSRQISGSINPEENIELGHILESYPDLRLQAELFAGMWEQEKKILPSIEVREAYMRHLLKHRSEFLNEGANEINNVKAEAWIPVVDQKNVFQIRGKNLLYACLLISLIITSFLFFYNRKPQVPDKSQNISSVITKYGNKSKVSLPDGSQVWLNAGSRLDYNSTYFNKSLRGLAEQ